MWGTRGRSRHANFASDQMGIQKISPRVTFLQNGSSVTGAGDTLAVSILASLVQDLRGLENSESLKETVEDSQVAAALTLKSEYAVSPSLPQVVMLGWYSAWFDSSYA